MARTTLRKRLTILFGVTVLAVLSLAGWYLSHQTRSLLIDQARLTAVAVARGIAAASSNDFFSYNYVALEQKAEEAAMDPAVEYVVFYDKEGRVAAYTGLGELTRGAAPPDLTSSGMPLEQERVNMQLQSPLAGPGIDVLVPVAIPGDRLWGAVRLGMGLEAIYRQIRRMTLIITLLGFASVAVVWLVAAVFTRRITVPVGRLVEASERVSGGDLSARVVASTGDELEDLAEKFNWMVERLGEQRDRLESNLQEIRTLKEYSDLVIWSMTNGLVTLAADGRITTFNRMAEEIFGVPAETASGRLPGEVWGAGSSLAGVLEEGCRSKREAGGVEVVWDGEHGRKVIGLSMAPVAQEGDDPVGYLALFTDLTEKKEMEDQIRRADRLAALGTLAAGLAHEIRNPLTAVRAFVQMFPEKAGQERFQEKFNRIVPRELERVTELIDNLLDLVRTPRFNMQNVDAGEIINQVLETLEPEMADRGVVLRRLPDNGPSIVMADEGYLSRGFHNIILNAVQAMPGGGTLTVAVSGRREGPSNGQVVVNVTDTGSGIPAEQVDQIFNPFFTSKEKGTGLGLAVTNKIIEDHGGSINVTSERGHGTTFRITLPAETV